MQGNEAATYGDTWAAHYDSIYHPPGADQIDFLKARADGGPILELAIGSGRVALPLLAAGVEVHGVEISSGMIEALRSNPGGEAVPIVASDMTAFTVTSPYPLILLGFNTLFGPLDEESQRGVFESVVGALAPGGSFVIDCFVPDLGRFDRGQTVRVREISSERIQVEYSIHHAASQRTDSMIEIRWVDGRSAMLPVAVRYMFPDQIDAMAESAGLRLSERYEWYDESPFTEDSPRHVSVYRIP